MDKIRDEETGKYYPVAPDLTNPPPAEAAQPTCLGYPECDGGLPGEPHEAKCPSSCEPPAERDEALERRMETIAMCELLTSERDAALAELTKADEKIRSLDHLQSRQSVDLAAANQRADDAVARFRALEAAGATMRRVWVDDNSGAAVAWDRAVKEGK